MAKASKKLIAPVAITATLAVLSLVFSATGVRDKPSEYGTKQPAADQATMKLNVQAAYDDTNMYWRYSWKTTDAPSITHDFLVYQDGKWVRKKGSADGAKNPQLNEDRLAFLLDDGSVDGFDKYGGFMTVYSFTHGIATGKVDAEELAKVFGKDMEELSKMLPGTMTDINDWRTYRGSDEVQKLREAGYFLDLWHWRAHRSNPLGYSDDQNISDKRGSDGGKGPYSTNFDKDAGTPKVMFDQSKTGIAAMDWNRVAKGEYTQNETYFISEDTSVPYDPNHQWKDGDAIPRRLLRIPEGSRGAIKADGKLTENTWNVELTRALDSGDATGDKALKEFGRYSVAPAVHSGTAGRFHYIGMPFTLGLGRDADVRAAKVNGAPDWSAIPTQELTLFYPGVISWDYLRDPNKHAGADAINKGEAFSSAHTIENMAYYALESEYRSEIKSQWLKTGGAWILLILSASICFIRLARRTTQPTPETTNETRK